MATLHYTMQRIDCNVSCGSKLFAPPIPTGFFTRLYKLLPFTNWRFAIWWAHGRPCRSTHRLSKLMNKRNRTWANGRTDYSLITTICPLSAAPSSELTKLGPFSFSVGPSLCMFVCHATLLSYIDIWLICQIAQMGNQPNSSQMTLQPYLCVSTSD